MLLRKYLIFVVIMLGIAAIADAEPAITINPVGNHQSGEKFNLTGTTTIENCKKIGIEIFPKDYWDSLSEYAMINNTGKVKFREFAVTSDNSNPAGINLVRYNSDTTQSYQPFEICSDHFTAVFPVKKDSNGQLHWTADINKNDNGTSFAPGKYHVNVWDATNQVDRQGVLMPNGWDIISKKIYPSTNMVNVWDPKNQKEMQYVEFNITNKSRVI